MITYKGKTYHPTKIWQLMKRLSEDGHMMLLTYFSETQMWACRPPEILHWYYDNSAYAALRRAMEANDLLDKENK